MINASERRIIASVLAAAALIAILSGCRKSGGGNADGTADATETAVVTTKEPLSTVIIDLNTTKPPAETGSDDNDHTGTKLPLTLDAGAEYIDKITFLCDFPVYGLRSLGMLSEGRKTDNVVTGIGGSFFVTSEEPMLYASEYGGLMTVSDYVSKRRPEYLLLAVGTSDIAAPHPLPYDRFGDSYTSLIEKIREASPRTVIICMSILPGSESSGISIYNAENYNSRIISAAEATGVYYLDAASAFAGSNGYLRADCDGGDSRLSTTGLRRLLDMIRTHCAG